MKELVLLSGKGGVGKTMVAVALATFLRDVVLVDANLDAPDLREILPHTFIHREAISGPRKASISNDCTNCGICRDACRFQAIIEVSSKDAWPRFQVDQTLCKGCRVCDLVCPQRAIMHIPSGDGHVLGYEIPCGLLFEAAPFHHEEQFGRMVGFLRRLARQAAIERNAELIITDGPPGIGPMAVSSLIGADAALLVTEPTQAAFAGLQRAYTLTSRSHRPAALVINMYGGDEGMTHMIENWCRSQGILVLGRLPFSEEIKAAVKAGRALQLSDDTALARETRHLAEGLSGFLQVQHTLASTPRAAYLQNDKGTSFLSPRPSTAYPGSIEP